VRTDVTVVEDCQALVDAAMDAFGRVDILVNNAGHGGEYHPATEDPPDHFRWMVDLNLMGSYWMAQAAGRVMRPGSSVINISSVMALTTAKMPAAAYSSAKAAILGLTRDLAAQWGPDKGIRVNAIGPGTIRTNSNRDRLDIPGAVEAESRRVPLGRLGRPEDNAAMAVALLSERFAGYVTGTTVVVDGGLALHNWIAPPA
jgi:NAD(P)-dependent dehydrogenase (short-subunit alcohol dehydrogenase family)